jgi:hypothetical protein
MSINSKNKGSTFERKIANLLSERFAPVVGVEKGFRRNPDSGSFFGGKNSKRVDSHNTETASFGDMICPSSFRFSVECKHYKSGPTFSALVGGGDIKQWDLWLAQAEADGKKSNREPLLIVKYNNVETIVITKITFDGLQHSISYKDYRVYRLDDVLSQPNSVFFL